MRILTLIPKGYSWLNSINKNFEKFNNEVITLDYLSFFKTWQNKLITKSNGLPISFKNKIRIHDAYRKKINMIYLEKIYGYKPNMVFVYNDQYLTYETAKEIQKITKLVFFLGDNPFFFHNHPINELGMYLNADYLFCCDSFITEFFKKAGQKKITEVIFGYDPTICYPMQPSIEEKERFSNDVVMIGRLYPTIKSSWTYKRLLFYKQFTNLDMKIYGHGWSKYKATFPELIQKVVNLDHYLTFDEINTLLSCCKVYPVEANPGIINGIHLRVFDCIGTEILPIVEYTKDLDNVFNEVEIPIIKNYKDAEKIAKYYIKNSEKRERLKKELKQFVNQRYTPQQAVFRMISRLF